MNAPGTILIGPSTYGDLDRAPIEKLESAGYSIRKNPVGRKMTKPELISVLDGIVGIIAGLEPLERDVLENSGLKVISRCGVGLDTVDVGAAGELGIQVFSTPNAPTVAVAELTIGVIIAMLRQVTIMNEKLHAGKWEKLSGPQLTGKTVTIIGLGRIGLKVASYLKAFDVRLLGVDPMRTGIVNGITVLPIEEALPQSDIVSIHASGNDEIIGARHFSLIRRGAYIVNTGRGSLVNEAALCAALENKSIAGAWLDTFSQEPYLGPLQQFSNVVMTPHIGYSSVESRREMEMEAAENLLRGLSQFKV